MDIRTVFAWFAAAAVLASVTAGCRRSSLDTVPVSGTVTYRGEPVRAGTVVFHPVDAVGSRPARATIGTDGTFRAATLESAPGLMAGEYKLAVAAPAVGIADVSPAQAATAARSNIPAKYGNPETSGLTVTMEAGKPVTLNLDLSD